MDGILNVNKPPGRTSFSVVGLVRRLSGERRVGHAGTLDPAASGVLPVCLGRATRVTEFLMETPKTYRAQVELGVATDTGDAEGQVVSRRDPSGVTRAAVLAALGSFLGEIQQVPPMFSALKRAGRPLYELARAGITVERAARPARIYRIELLDWAPPLVTIEVVCGRGTYIRALAMDLGEKLGCGAHLHNLIRTRVGPFDLAGSVSLPELEFALRARYWLRYLDPPDTVLLDRSAIIAGAATEEYIRHGRPLPAAPDGPFPAAGPDERCRAYTLDGCFLGVLRFNAANSHWQPEKVFL